MPEGCGLHAFPVYIGCLIIFELKQIHILKGRGKTASAINHGLRLDPVHFLLPDTCSILPTGRNPEGMGRKGHFLHSPSSRKVDAPIPLGQKPAAPIGDKGQAPQAETGFGKRPDVSLKSLQKAGRLFLCPAAGHPDFSHRHRQRQRQRFFHVFQI